MDEHLNETDLVQGTESIEKNLGTTFPVDVFPKEIRDELMEICQLNNLRPEMVFASLLATFSGTIGNTIHVRYNNAWSSEPLIIYLALVADSSQKKSQSFKETIEIIKEIEYNRWGDPEFDKDEVLGDEANSSILLSIYTKEALVKILAENKKGRISYQDELSTLFSRLLADKDSVESNYYLTIFNGGDLKNNFKTSEAGSYLASKPFLTLMGGLQPQLIHSLKGRDNLYNGLLNRFLYVYPDKDLDKKLLDSIEINKSQAIKKTNLKKIFKRAYYQKIKIDDRSNVVIPFELKAKDDETLKYLDELRFEYFDKINDDYRGSNIIRSAIGKMESYQLRFAGILAIMRYYLYSPKELFLSHDLLHITKEDIDGSFMITEYFFKVFKYVAEIIEQKQSYHQLDQNIKQLYDDIPNEFKRSDILPLVSKHKVKMWRFNDLLSNPELFRKISHGVYEKKLIYREI